MKKKLTTEQWNIIEEPIVRRIDLKCNCKPLCRDCLHAMWESQEIHRRLIRSNITTFEGQCALGLKDPKKYSKSLIWYEVTYTYPNKNKERALRSIAKLKKYTKSKEIDGRFEIGKKGLYHMHFLIKTHKYLRLREIKKINDNFVTHLSRLRGIEGLKFQNYIEKDASKSRPLGWDFNFSE